MKKISLRFKILFNSLFILYSIILFYTLFLGFDRLPLFNKSPIDYNIIPFHTINYFFDLDKGKHWQFFIINIVGNVLMFIPLGFWLSFHINKFFKFSFCFIIIILGIELLQLITKIGTGDIDDVILNYLGGIIGYLFFKSLKNSIFE